MDGRRDGEKLTWKWLQENQPVPYEDFSNFYVDLSQFVETQRAGYLALEIKSQNIAKANNILLQSFPNNIYNKVLNRSQIDYKPGFTSTKTQQIFQHGIEDVE
jgi:gamma-glutamylcysteine synthetase